MLKRKFEDKLSLFKTNSKALLIAGARQVGKTFIIRKFGKEQFNSFVEINLIQDVRAKELFSEATDTTSFLLALSLFAGNKVPKASTLTQMC